MLTSQVIYGRNMYEFKYVEKSCCKNAKGVKNNKQNEQAFNEEKIIDR
jgi:hypothetical protein